MTLDEPPKPQGGPAVRLSGASRDAALHDQLFRYAEDMQEQIDNNRELEQRYRTLCESYESIVAGKLVFENLVRSSKDIYLITNRDGIILQCNPVAITFAPAVNFLGTSLADLIFPSYLKRFEQLLEQLAQGGEDPQEWVELHLMLKKAIEPDIERIVEAYPIPVRDKGDLRAIHWMIRDVTRAREAQYESKISSLVLDIVDEAITVTDCDGTILAVNPAFTRITGYSAAEAIGRNHRLLSSGLQNRDFYDKMWSAIRTTGHWHGQIVNRKKSGEVYTQWLAVTTAKDSNGTILSYIGVFTDLTRLVDAEMRLSHLASHDVLTQLPNRQLLQDRLQQMISLAARRKETFAMLFVDLDHFKSVNDSFGHAVGDQLLRAVAARLEASVRAADTVARIGADEFVILISELSQAQDIAIVAKKIIDALVQPILIGAHTISTGASIGCALYPAQGQDMDALLKHADIAKCQAKQRGGNTHEIYRTIKEPEPAITTLLGNTADIAQ